jgi:signal transduction histidine kinase
MTSIPSPPEFDAVCLVEAAFAGEPREGMNLLLRKVTEMSDALGCVLWRAGPDAEPLASPPKGRISLLAGWFNTTLSSQLLAVHGLPFNENSVTWKAMRSEKPSLSNDLVNDDDPTAKEPFFTHHNITRSLVAPLCYVSGRHGAISIYRRQTASDFHLNDATSLAKIAKLLPLLYRAVRDRAAFSLVREVGQVLRNHRYHSGVSAPRNSQQKTVAKLGEALQRMFQAVEVSVFLELGNRPGVFTCAFTTEGPHTTLIGQTEYQPPYANSFSGLALRTGKGVRVYDTQSCEAQIKEFQQKFRGFTRKKSPALSEESNIWLGVPQGWKPQPHSLMVVPLINSHKVYGFLRCWIARKGAPFFSMDDLDLLQLVAEQFTHAVETWQEESGVFASLSQARSDAHSAKEDAVRSQIQQRMTLENIHHQMKGPLAEAKRRVDDILEGERSTSSVELNAIRSMLYRSSLMSKTIGILTKLDQGEQLEGLFANIEPLALIRLVGEICQNSQFRISEDRNIKIEFNSDSMFKLAPVNLRGNLDLIAEALNNVVDNALKYSYDNTRIRVFAHVGRTQRFFIAVTNSGVVIHPQDIASCKQRFWRGVEAKRFTGEGSGIGLWVVEHIMKALGGELQIIPTRPNDNVTEVRLVFDVV